MHSGTLFATTVSKRGNMDTQIFATNQSWSFSFPMKLKSEANEASSLLFQWDRVPPVVIFDNAQEMILGEFNLKLKEALCHFNEMGSFTQWPNAAKREIKELKKGSGRKLIKSDAPKRLWDVFLKLESYIRSNTAHGIYKLGGEVPEAIKSGKMPNISQFFEFEWFKCVMF